MKKLSETYTYKEICQQPTIWKVVYEQVLNDIDKINAFMEQNLKKDTKIVFTGAGSSEFIGNSIAPYLKSLGHNVISIATTDIVSTPYSYLGKNEDFILVSFARSGNSPESLGTVEIIDKLYKNSKHVFITCNKDGQLAKKQGNNIYKIILPDEVNDKSFAMTSSFTSMALAGILITDIKSIEKYRNDISMISDYSTKIIEFYEKEAKELSQMENNRIVYLGSSYNNGFSQESCLKTTELTGGIIDSYYNSILGFRHGPKSIINNKTIIILFMSTDSYTRKYELDLINEIKNDNECLKLIILDPLSEFNIKSVGFKMNLSNLISSSFIFMIFTQLYSTYKSLSINIDPDNPCPKGTVNRVVKGVTIYNL